MSEIRNDWTREEVSAIYWRPLIDLIYQGATVHREHHNARKIQTCSLLSVKTGGCSEDCKYCSQSSRYQTGVEAERIAPLEDVVRAAQAAKTKGASRFCMGAAWRGMRNSKQFEQVLEMVRTVDGMGLQVCCTLGMVTPEQAKRLKEAGLYAYNHNLDTSEKFYPEVITTRSYADRLETLKNVRDSGLTVCCGAILGLGEGHDDRIDLLHTLATLPKHPESVPINTLVPIEGTPLGGQGEKVSVADRVRMIATARILMPKTMIRLSAGRNQLTPAEQTLCFLAGANSIWVSDKLLTTRNCEADDDAQLFEALGLEAIELGPDSGVASASCPRVTQ